MEHICYNSQLDDLLPVIDNLANAMLTHTITDSGVLDRHTKTATYYLQRNHIIS